MNENRRDDTAATGGPAPSQRPAESGNGPSAGVWLPVETAPIGDYILIWGGAWRHPFVGRYFGRDWWVFVDNADTNATQSEYVATHWMPLPEPPK